MGAKKSESTQSTAKEEALRARLERLTQRRAQIIQIFNNVKPKNHVTKRTYLDKRQAKELNLELAAINSEIKQHKMQLGEPKEGNPIIGGRKKPTQRDPAPFRKDEPLPPPGTWIHVWRG